MDEFTQREEYETGRIMGETDRAVGIEYRAPWGTYKQSAAAQQGYLVGWVEQDRLAEDDLTMQPDTEDGARYEIDLEWFDTL